MKINSQKLLPSRTESLSLIAISGNKVTALSTDKKTIKFGEFISEVENIAPKKTRKRKITAASYLRVIRDEVLKIEKILRKTIKRDKNYEEKTRIRSEKKKRKKREEELEKPKVGPAGAALIKKLVPTNIFDAIKNFIGNILLGRFVLFLIESVDKFKKFIDFIAPVASFLNDLTGKIFNGVVSLIEGVYDINKKVKDEIKSLGGEGAEKEYSKFTDALKRYLNLAIILTMAGIPSNLGGGPGKSSGPPKGPDGKPVKGPFRRFFQKQKDAKPRSSGGKSGLRSYLNRSKEVKLIERKYGNSAAKIYENARKTGKSASEAKNAITRAIQKGKITVKSAGPGLGRGVGATRGGIFRRGIGRVGSRLQTKVLGRGARLGISRLGSQLTRIGGSALGRIPILGPLLIGIDTYMETGKLDKALFLAGGSALGGFLGSFIPIPILGTLVGTLIGEYVGDLFYTLIRGGGPDALGRKLKNDIKKLIDTGVLIKDWILKGIANIQHDNRFESSNPVIRGALRLFPLKMGAWPILLDPLDFNLFRKIDILKKAFFSESRSRSPYSLRSGDQVGPGFDPDMTRETAGGMYGGYAPTGRQKEIYDYLVNVKKLNDVQALGLMANIMRESSFRTDPGLGGAGEIGMFQWNPQVGRAQKMEKAVPDWRTNWKGQIDYALTEFTGPQYVAKSFRNAQEAADWWMNNWEKPGDPASGSKKHAEYLKTVPRAPDGAAKFRGREESKQLADALGDLTGVGISDSAGRAIKLKGEAARAFIDMAAAAKKEGIDIGSGVSNAYRTPEHNRRVGGASNSRHLRGLAFDINWNTKAGMWIRNNAHKFGFKHNDYSATSTHFDWVGGYVPQNPLSKKEKEKGVTGVKRYKGVKYFKKDGKYYEEIPGRGVFQLPDKRLYDMIPQSTSSRSSDASNDIKVAYSSEPVLKQSKPNLNTDILRTKASYESNQSLLAIQPLIIEKTTNDTMFPGPVMPAVYS